MTAHHRWASAASAFALGCLVCSSTTRAQFLDSFKFKPVAGKERETICLPRAGAPPAVDGVLSDAVWKAAWRTDRFTWGGGRSGTNGTVLMAAYDAENLALCRAFGYEWIRESPPRKTKPALEFPMTVGTEAGGMGRCQSDIVSGVIKGIYNVMKKLGMFPGEPEIPPKAKVYSPYHLYAERGGFFISNVRAGDMVEKGEVLGVIKDLWGETLEEITVPTDGVIHMVTSPAIWEGDVVYEIGKDIREIE